MNATFIVSVFAASAIAAIAIVIKMKLGSGAISSGATPGFKAKPMLTANELEFLSRLEAATPELRYHSQVSMGALIEPAVSRRDAKEYFRARGMFSQKIVDFVAQHRKDGTIVAVIELDDRTHDSEKDGRRDVMLATAGYQVVRWTSKAKPDLATIRAKLLPSSVAAASVASDPHHAAAKTTPVS